jgi:hypothetical protein
MRSAAWNERNLLKPVLAWLLIAAWILCSAGCRQAHVLPPSLSGKPYLKKIEQIESIAVWVVNGQYVRQNLDEEFTNFGQHYRFHFIPANEFWLDQEGAPGEERFFINHLMLEYRLMREGMDYDEAIEKADIAEKAERAKTKSAEEGTVLIRSGRNAQLISKVHKKLLQQYGAAAKVWIVDGELVRDLFFIDFTEGGHDRVYQFIPEGEIWIDDDVMPEERIFILLHEMHERYLMAQGWKYGKAHKDSSRIEFQCRRHPAELDAALREEIRKNAQILSRK